MKLKGLSPRVRGNQALPVDQALRKVYPRVCGGTITHHATRCARRGLSPRVRGNQTIVQAS